MKTLKLRNARKAELFTLTSGFTNSNSMFVNVRSGKTFPADPTWIGKGDERHQLHVKYEGYLYCTRPNHVFATLKGGRHGWSDIVVDSDIAFRAFNPFLTHESMTDGQYATVHITKSEMGVFITMTGYPCGELRPIGKFATLWGECEVFATPFKGLKHFMRLIRQRPEWATNHFCNRSYSDDLTRRYDYGKVETCETGFNPLVDAYGEAVEVDFVVTRRNTPNDRYPEGRPRKYAVRVNGKCFMAGNAPTPGEEFVCAWQGACKTYFCLGAEEASWPAPNECITHAQFMKLADEHGVQSGLAYVRQPKEELTINEELIMDGPYAAELTSEKSWNYVLPHVRFDSISRDAHNARARIYARILAFVDDAMWDELVGFCKFVLDARKAEDECPDTAIYQLAKQNLVQAGDWQRQSSWYGFASFMVHCFYMALTKSNINVFDVLAEASLVAAQKSRFLIAPFDVVAWLDANICRFTSGRVLWAVRNHKRYAFKELVFDNGTVEYERTTHGVMVTSRDYAERYYDFVPVTKEEFETYTEVPMVLPEYE